MRAYWTFKDVKGVTHKNGEEWLIKMADTEAHIPDVYEEVRIAMYNIEKECLTTLYCTWENFG